MGTIRTLLLRHRGLAVALIVLALLIKAAVPAGFMIGARSMVLTIEICADSTGERLSHQIVLPLTREAAPASGGKAATGCAFSSLWAGGLAGNFPAFVAAAILFALALGFAPVAAPRLQSARFLRPPLRAPPLSA